MKLYLGGAETHWKKLADANADAVLFSYYHARSNFKRRVEQAISYYRRKKRFPDTFLDSGAFTNQQSGARVDIWDYIEFVKKTRKFWTVYANLDIQPPAVFLENQRLMEENGLTPIPVYHYSEFANPEYRDLFIKWLDKYDYIALGGLVRGRQGNPFPMYSWCFKHAIPKKVKLHIFGITDTRTLKMFPWYSADSTCWLAPAKYGVIYHFSRGSMRCIGREALAQCLGKRPSWFWTDATVHSLVQWRKFGEYLAEFHKNNHYWEDDEYGIQNDKTG